MTNTNDEELVARLQEDKELQFFHNHKVLEASSPENKQLKTRIGNELDIDNLIMASRCVLVFLGGVILLLANLVSADFSMKGNITGLAFFALALFAPRKFHIGFGSIVYIIISFLNF